MSGLIQRLLDRTGAGTPAAAPVIPMAVSSSPLAMQDQRLHDPAFRDPHNGLPDLVGDTSLDTQPMDDFGTAQSPMVPPPIPSPARRAAPTVQASVLPDIQTAPLPLVPLAPMRDPIAALRAADRNDQPDRLDPPIAPAVPSLPVDPIEPSAAPARPDVTQDQPAVPAQPKALDRQGMDQIQVPTPAQDTATDTRAPQPLPPAKPLPPIHSVLVEDPVTAPSAETVKPEVEPQMLRPVVTQTVPAQDPAPDHVPPRSDASNERTVERVVETVLERQTPAPAVQQAGAPSKPPTAASVSRIGSLPSRRSVQTLFGAWRS